MATCSRCGREVAADASFCAGCGAPLALAPAREERKVVTVLFADLVGFTSRSESLDPEDVRALLSPYYSRLRSELERCGGTVEKFIGDAVMAVFGAPTAHEDDPERAVRAALAIRDWADEQTDLHVRIAVNTGEALVALGARPSEGEGMLSGDVVNTTARLQLAAPVDGILVGEQTYRATRHAIDYRAATAVEAKGKAAPISVWRAEAARSRFGVDVVQGTRSSLVGRARELHLLLDALARTCDERTPQLVTLVGVPGIGKSRLAYELLVAVGAEPDAYQWRQGRCLPYGDGISYWALAEMVKAHSGINEDDGREQTAAKLTRAAREAVPEGEVDWVESHLRTLVGLDTEFGATARRRDEAFTAWRSFWEGIADSAPLVLVFEDLHWADDGLLDFVDNLVEWSHGVAILVLCLARPELLDRRPAWGGGKLNALTLALSPLGDEDAARLIADVLDQRVLPPETQRTLLERSGGNPLYAEQYAQLFRECGVADDLPLPESVQGIIAARLDALPDEEKALLQDASVFGKVFWVGALGRHDGVEGLLHSLERKEFVRRERRASIAGEAEFAFRHVLVRDVAYAQIPRATRAQKHERASDWIESLGRAEDHAELLAHHCSEALELAQAAGVEHGSLARRTCAALRAAGDRATSLSAFATAADYYIAALSLVPVDDVDRPALLLRLGKAFHRLEEARGESILREARDALGAAGDLEAAAEAEAALGELLWAREESARALECLEAAAAKFSDLPTSPAKAYVLSSLARIETFTGKEEQAISHARSALAIAEELGRDDLRAHALNNLGTVRFRLGDHAGMADLERSLEIAIAANSWEVLRAYFNLSGCAELLYDHRRARELEAEGLRAAERFGSHAWIRSFKQGLPGGHYAEGRWDDALSAQAELIEEAQPDPPPLLETVRLFFESAIALARDDTERAVAGAEALVAMIRQARGSDPMAMAAPLAHYATALWYAGRVNDARDVADELTKLVTENPSKIGSWPEVAASLRLLGRGLDILRPLSIAPATPGTRAASHYVLGEFAEAADILAQVGLLHLEADARLRAAEALVASGRHGEAETHLQRALAFYRSAGATRWIREGEALLAATA